MLKGKRQLARSVVPGSTVALTNRQLHAYTAAFAAISPEFDEMQQMGQQVRNLPRSILEAAAESSDAATITVGGIVWQTQAQLLKLPKSTVYLCRHPTENEFAIIQQFPAESAYAKANGQGEILLRNDDSRQLVSEYVGRAQHTLRFMASNLVARAQHVAFERFPECNPGNVVQAISERCLLAVGESLTVMESVGQTTRQTRGIRI
jgi:flagellar biosynthesis component FlhA